MSYNSYYDHCERTLSFPQLNKVFECILGQEIRSQARNVSNGQNYKGSHNGLISLSSHTDFSSFNDDSKVPDYNGDDFNSPNPKETEKTRKYPLPKDMLHSQSSQNRTTLSQEEMINNGNGGATYLHGRNMIYNGKGGADDVPTQIYKVRQEGSYDPPTQSLNQRASPNQMGEERQQGNFKVMFPNNRQQINSPMPSTEPWNQSAQDYNFPNAMILQNWSTEPWNQNASPNQMTLGGEDRQQDYNVQSKEFATNQQSYPVYQISVLYKPHSSAFWNKSHTK